MDSPAILGKASTPSDYLERGRWDYQADQEKDSRFRTRAGENSGANISSPQMPEAVMDSRSNTCSFTEQTKTSTKGQLQDPSAFLNGMATMRISEDVENFAQDTSPYYEYALSTLDRLDGKNSSDSDIDIQGITSIIDVLMGAIKVWLIEPVTTFEYRN